MDAIDPRSLDVREYADFRRDELRNASSCRKCGSREPARLAPDGCSDCTEFDRCFYCGRWIEDEPLGVPGALVGYRWVDDAEAQGEVKCCDVCWKGAR